MPVPWTMASSFCLVVSLLLMSPVASPAQLANQPPVPVWLGNSEEYQLKFSQEGKLLMAVVLVAADREAEVQVNGKNAGVAGDPAKATSINITPLVKAGANVLTVQAKDGRPVRMAALLELNGDLAASRWMATDDGWTTPKGKAEVQGLVGANANGGVPADPAADPFNLKKTFDAYNSWQLAKRDQQSRATDPDAFTVPEGFVVEMMRSAQADEDSWVAMTFDTQGRIILAREKRGLLRLDPKGGMEVVEDTLLECRGLVMAQGALYAHANNTKALFRLRDLDGNGTYEDKVELLRTEGGVGHGRNHLKLGPDGRLWLANGNNVLLPSSLGENSPLRNYAWDQVLPNPWDGTMFDGNVEMPAGHILRVSLDGAKVDLIAGGLRNPLDLAFNRQGELFTFDADMERDVGASWYMPTRVLHVVPGADFGWRRGTGRFPAWYVDTLPSVVDIGLSSPTAVFFGYGARFPAKYQEALYIFDWSYGRIIAVHLKPDGASYMGTQENFIAGRPLNVTDGCIGPDGALWFITGGRGTQSGLYRVTYRGEVAAPPPDGEFLPGAIGRSVRRGMESVLEEPSVYAREGAASMIWIHLDDDDRFVRHAARVALERVPIGKWMNWLDGKGIYLKNKPWQIILGNLAMARVGPSTFASDVVEHLLKLDWATLSEEQRLAVLRVLAVAMARHGDVSEPQRASLLAALEPRYPARDFSMNQELCRLLIRLKSSMVLEKSIALMEKAQTSEELLFFPLHLRYVKEGWRVEQRRAVFVALNRAEKFPGASAFFKALLDTRNEMAAALKPDEALQLAAVIHPAKPVALSPHAMPGHTFKAWKVEDLEPRLAMVASGRSFEKGRAAAISAQCVFCHRMSADPTLPAGILGPELVQVSARFSRRDLLDHILNPSKVIDEKFRFVTITQKGGAQITGSLESEDDERVKLRPNPLSPDTVEVGKSMITGREVSLISPMPAGLVNGLKEDQLLDLLAFIESGGNAQGANFKTAGQGEDGKGSKSTSKNGNVSIGTTGGAK